MKTKTKCLIIILLIVAIIFGGVYMNKKSTDDAYNDAVALIANGNYEDALVKLEKANNDLDRDGFGSDVKCGLLDDAYKNTVCLYAYAMAQIGYDAETVYMHTVNDYLEIIPASYSGELSEEIKKFKEDFKIVYDEFVAEEECKAEEEHIKMIQEEEQRIRSSSSSTPKKKINDDDPYNVDDYYDAEDFYEDNYDDFWDYEDAEDYYDEHHD